MRIPVKHRQYFAELLCFIAHLNDDVLFRVAAVFSEEVDAADIPCAVLDADAQGRKIVAVELQLGKSEHTVFIFKRRDRIFDITFGKREQNSTAPTHTVRSMVSARRIRANLRWRQGRRP